MNIFKFRPIGQGLFYTGSLDNGAYNFVYDCGTDSSCIYLDNEVRRFACEVSSARNKSELDFVVISHLHKDHINGLCRLNKFFRIKQIYLPYLYDTDTTLMYLACILLRDNDSDENRQIFEFVSRFYIRELSSETEVVYLTGRNTNAVVTTDGGFEYFTQPFYIRGWNFYFISKQICKEQLEMLHDKVSEFLEDNNIADLRQYVLTNGYNKIQGIYEEVFKRTKLNATSTLLLHFPDRAVFSRKTICEASFCCHWHICCDVCPYYANCYETFGITLLTGDAEFDDEMSRNVNIILKNREIDFFQIPHHGSRNNWHMLPHDCFGARNYVISFGLGNRYRHPCQSVIESLIRGGRKFYCVTQQCGFNYYLSD